MSKTNFLLLDLSVVLQAWNDVNFEDIFNVCCEKNAVVRDVPGSFNRQDMGT